MKTVQEIFENALFRIPDYQRGYSWKETHLDDLWQDMLNLQQERFHYTGALTIEVPEHKSLEKWKGDDWIIESGSFKPFYVVDGQQRITTIVLLLNILIELMDDEEQYLYQTKNDLIAKYLFKRNDKKKLHSFIFGYEIDDPSYEFLKTKIFKQESSDAENQPETSYTNNLAFADRFFRLKVENWEYEKRENLFRTVTQKLKFDVKIIESDLDIFVVFETMNNRGKPLTNLEKLKNRLIYLTTLMPDTDPAEKSQLRKEINDVWKTCYEYLGKNKRNLLPDDIFLRNHFIMYHYFEKTKDFPYVQIFKEIYTVQNTILSEPEVDFKTVRKYISSLQKASKVWFIINNPRQALNSELIGEDEAYWLEKLMRLGIGSFGPLTLAVLLTSQQREETIEYFKAVESFIFLNLHCSGRKSSLGNTHFPTMASSVYHKKQGHAIKEVTATLNEWTFGNNEEEGYYTPDRFVTLMKDQFSHSRKNGYYDWPGLKYLLFEYEEYLQGDEVKKVKWKTPNSIEHIYPQSEADKDWRSVFSDFTTKQKSILCNSLGNLVLLSGSKNSQLSNKSFDFKKKHKTGENSSGGYYTGSHSEIEVSQSRNWNAKSIFTRGKKILEFMQERWGIEFTAAEKKNLLLGDDRLIEKMK